MSKLLRTSDYVATLNPMCNRIVGIDKLFLPFDIALAEQETESVFVGFVIDCLTETFHPSQMINVLDVVCLIDEVGIADLTIWVDFCKQICFCNMNDLATSHFH